MIGGLGIDDESAATIFPHEQTLPKAKSDRLDLLAATRANLSPIWGLSLTPGSPGPSNAPIRPGPRRWTATASATSSGSSRTTTTIGTVREAVGASPVVLADGHHRFETARTYRAGRSGDPGADLVMALVVELTADQLEVGPIHRALSGLPDGLDLVDVCSSWFDLTRVGDFDERTTSALGQSGALALLMPSGTWLLSPKDGTAEAAGSDLDSSMVALVIAELPDHELEYLNSWQEGVRAVADDKSQAVLLLRPVTVEQIAEWATGREAHAPQDHLLPSQTGHRDGVPLPRLSPLVPLPASSRLARGCTRQADPTQYRWWPIRSDDRDEPE